MKKYCVVYPVYHTPAGIYGVSFDPSDQTTNEKGYMAEVKLDGPTEKDILTNVISISWYMYRILDSESELPPYMDRRGRTLIAESNVMEFPDDEAAKLWFKLNY
jgi:hypothetical protein